MSEKLYMMMKLSNINGGDIVVPCYWWSWTIRNAKSDRVPNKLWRSPAEDYFLPIQYTAVQIFDDVSWCLGIYENTRQTCHKYWPLHGATIYIRFIWAHKFPKNYGCIIRWLGWKLEAWWLLFDASKSSANHSLKFSGKRTYDFPMKNIWSVYWRQTLKDCLGACVYWYLRSQQQPTWLRIADWATLFLNTVRNPVVQI